MEPIEQAPGCFAVSIIGYLAVFAAKILIVEDEPFIAIDLAEHVRDWGGAVVGPFPRAALALDYLGSERPAGAIVDANLPDGVSTSVLERLCQADVPVVLYTGRGASAEVLAACRHLRVLIKPAVTNAVVGALVEEIEKAGGFRLRN